MWQEKKPNTSFILDFVYKVAGNHGATLIVEDVLATRESEGNCGATPIGKPQATREVFGQGEITYPFIKYMAHVA